MEELVLLYVVSTLSLFLSFFSNAMNVVVFMDEWVSLVEVSRVKFCKPRGMVSVAVESIEALVTFGVV